MTPLRQRMLEDMQLRGLAPRTQQSYLHVVQQLAHHYGKSPDLLTDEDLRQYFLYLRNEKRAARNTCTLALCAIKFFYQHTLKRDWSTLDFVRPPREHKLPVVLSPDEVWRLLEQIRLPHYRVCLSTIYACGLRLLEGVHLQAGKGNKDRYVPLPPRILTLLHAHWLTHRNPVWLFPAHGPAGCGRPTATEPMAARGLQHAFHAAVQELGLT